MADTKRMLREALREAKRRAEELQSERDGFELQGQELAFAYSNAQITIFYLQGGNASLKNSRDEWAGIAGTYAGEVETLKATIASLQAQVQRLEAKVSCTELLAGDWETATTVGKPLGKLKALGSITW